MDLRKDSMYGIQPRPAKVIKCTEWFPPKRSIEKEIDILKLLKNYGGSSTNLHLIAIYNEFQSKYSISSSKNYMEWRWVAKNDGGFYMEWRWPEKLVDIAFRKTTGSQFEQKTRRFNYEKFITALYGYHLYCFITDWICF